MSTAEFAAVLRAAGLDLGWKDVRDCLWLAGVLDDGADRAVDPPPEPVAAVVPYPTPPTTPDRPTGDGGRSGAPSWEPDAPQPAQPAPPEDAVAADPVRVHLPDESPDPLRSVPGLPVRLAHSSRPLPDSLRIARELRPLKRRVPVRGRTVVDEDATVDAVSEALIWSPTPIWNPVLRPELGRWLDLHLVVDSGASMVVWEPMALDLGILLARTTAFRRIRAWRLDVDGERAVLQAGGLRNPTAVRPGSAVHDPRETFDPTGRTVVVVLSDCVGAGWTSGAVDDVLAGWARSGPVVIWQPLPARLWRRTGLRPQRATVHGTRPAQPNAGYRVRSARGTDPGPVVPVIGSGDGSLARWAGLVASGGSADLAVRPVSAGPVPVSRPVPAAETPAEIIRRFRSSASATAMQLAVYLSAIPLTPDTMRLAQEKMLPHSRSSHLAEVFLGGLLRDVTGSDGAATRHYDYAPGVREALLSSVTREEAMTVLDRVADAGSLALTSSGGFRAVLTDPLGSGAEVLRSVDRPFAKVARTVLARLGGDHAELVRRDAAGEQPADAAVTVDDPVPADPAPSEPAPTGPPGPPGEPLATTLDRRRPQRRGGGGATRSRRGIVSRLRRPLLFVGIGGSGCRVGADLERQLRAELCGPDGTRLLDRLPGDGRLPYELPSCVQFVYVDLNGDDLGRVRRDVVPGPEHDAAARRTMRSTTELIPSHITSSDQATQSLRTGLGPDVVGWLPDARREPRVSPLRVGAGGMPGVARAVLFETLRRNPDDARRPLVDALTRLNASGADLDVASDGETMTTTGQVDVFVAFSVAGGTGAGLFHDYLHLVGDMVGHFRPELRIVPLVLTASAFDEGGGVDHAADLNAGSALIDLGRLLDDQNAPHPDDPAPCRTDFPLPVGAVTLRAATVPVAFLFGAGAENGSRADVEGSASALAQVLIGSADPGPRADASAHRHESSDSGVGRRGVATAAVASLTDPVHEVAEILGLRLLAAAVTGPPDGSRDDLATRFLDAGGLGELRRPEPVAFPEPTLADGYDSIVRGLNERARAINAALFSAERQLLEPTGRMAARFDPVAACSALLRGGVVDLLRLCEEAEHLGRATDDLRHPPDPPDGISLMPPMAQGLRRRRFTVLRAGDPSVQAVVEQQDRWREWRTRQVWSTAWDRHSAVWGHALDRVVGELVRIRERFAAVAADADDRIPALTRALHTGPALAPVDDLDRLYRDVLGRLAGDDVREIRVLDAIVGWDEVYRVGRDDPAGAVALVARTVQRRIADVLRSTAHGHPVLPRLADRLPAAARGADAALGRAVADLVRDDLVPPGRGPLRAHVGYPADDPDPAVEAFLLRQLPARTVGPQFAATRGDTLTVTLLRTDMGVLDVPDVRRSIGSWHAAVHDDDPRDDVAWRRRFAPDAGFAVLTSADRTAILHRMLCALGNGHLVPRGDPVRPHGVDLRYPGHVVAPLDLTTDGAAPSWAGLLPAYERWLVLDDDPRRTAVAARLMSESIGPEGTPAAQPFLDLVETAGAGSADPSPVAQEFWNVLLPAALDLRFGIGGRTLRTLASP